ncbi:MAG: hypothetical protein FWD15_03440 [Alphaproteobacteria bacterium]|nr:hypothetical protein [Alphaproteobacteria bacterium]
MPKTKNPFTQYTLKQWSVAYVRAAFIFILSLIGLGLLGYGFCAEPLRLGFICGNSVIEAIISFIGNIFSSVIPVIVKLGVYAYVIRALVALFIFTKGKSATKTKNKKGK